MTTSGAAEGTGARQVRRLPIVIVVVVLLVAAIVVGNGHSTTVRAAPAASGNDAAAMPPPTARSTAWYCPGPPPSQLLAHATEQVAVSNLADQPVDVGVTLLSDKGAITRRGAHANPNSTAMVASGAAANGAAIVEPFAADVAVQSTTTGDGVLATAPCATQPAADWEFAAGNTRPGTEDWIVLFNPFGDDAIVDVSFSTESGFARPDALQSKTIPRRSRVAIPVHEFVRYHNIVATSITTHTGRIVAQQTLIFSQNGKADGVTRTLGAASAGLQSVFASGVSGAAGSNDVRTLAVSDPTDVDGQVYVQVTPVSNKVVVQPVTVSVPRHSVVTVQLGNCPRRGVTCIPMPDQLQYSLLVHATRNVGFVAQDLLRWDHVHANGANAMLGTSDPSRNWVIAGVPAAVTTTWLDLRDQSATPATVSVTLVVNGKAITPKSLQSVVVPPGNRTEIKLTGMPEYPNASTSILVRSNQPVVAQRTLYRSDDASVDVGIPVRD